MFAQAATRRDVLCSELALFFHLRNIVPVRPFINQKVDEKRIHLDQVL